MNVGAKHLAIFNNGGIISFQSLFSYLNKATDAFVFQK